MHLVLSSVKLRLFCSGGDELTHSTGMGTIHVFGNWVTISLACSDMAGLSELCQIIVLF